MSYGAIAVAGIGAIVNANNAAKNRKMAEEQLTNKQLSFSLNKARSKERI